MESCATLLSQHLKKNLFNLFASWCGPLSKPLGIISTTGSNLEEEKLQFSSLQVILFMHIVWNTHTYFLSFKAMSALLCCGPIFESQYLLEDGVLYKWLDSLLISKDEKVLCLFNFMNEANEIRIRIRSILDITMILYACKIAAIALLYKKKVIIEFSIIIVCLIYSRID